MTLIERIIARAKSDKHRIVLPESTEDRTLQAADSLIEDEVAHIVLIGDETEIQ